MCTDLLERWGEGRDSEQNFLGLFLVPTWGPGGLYPRQFPWHTWVWEIKGEEGAQVIKSEPVLDGPAKSSNAVCPLYRWENGGIERGHEVPSKLHGTSVPHHGG